MAESAGSLFRAGKLTEAVAAASAAVKAAPGDLAARVLLAELLLFAGNIERADVILDAAADIDPQAAMVVAEFRQLLRAETARRQLRRDGRVPEFLGEPTPTMQLALAVQVAVRAGDFAEAAKQAAALEETRPRAAGTHDGTPYDDFRDACDLHVGFFEVLTTTGKYFWVPTEQVISAEFHKPERPRDLAWRRVTMSVREGPDGVVYIPAIYGSDVPDLADKLRLGRETDWQEQEGFTRGLGQRVFLVGDDPATVMELGTLEFGS
ncbi:MAG TPA: type VI secretion system accessory protein TagJ [Acetobacteraceae bacterium]|nr:type VI secretion system accessory protein TagJ [Acetobacteraceae bacterium]